MRHPVKIRPLRDWMHLVRKVESHPCNRDGQDKTWVLDLMEGLHKLFANAKPVDPGRPRARLR